MRKRKGLRAQMRDFNHITREIRNAAEREAHKRHIDAALTICIDELTKLHSQLYPNCRGDCPTCRGCIAIDMAIRARSTKLPDQPQAGGIRVEPLPDSEIVTA